MERIYSALTRLAGVALVMGLVAAFVLVFRVAQNYSIGFGPNGLVGPLSGYVVFQIVAIYNSVTFTLIAGVTLMGIVVAWVEQHRGWLVTLLLVAIASIFAQFALNVWAIFHPPTPSQPDMAQYQLIYEIQTFATYTAQLIPVTLVLVFARRNSGAARHAEDASLEVTRSAL